MTDLSVFSTYGRALGLGLVLFGCGGQRPAAAPVSADAAAASGAVRTYGSLRAAIEERRLDSVISLSRLRDEKALVGFGLLSALRGEVMMVGGESWLSYPKSDGTLRSEKAGANDETLAFLVVASVPDWQSVPLTEDTKLDELGEVVARLATTSGLDAEKPLPFLVEGALVNLQYSVINGAPFATDPQISREALRTASPRVKLESAQGTLVGFYSPEEQPDFLDPDTDVHVHVVVSSRNEAGHVENVDLPRGTNIRLPLSGGR